MHPRLTIAKRLIWTGGFCGNLVACAIRIQVQFKKHLEIYKNNHHLAAQKSFHASQAQLPETPLTIQEAETRSNDDVRHARQVSDEDDVPEYAKARETPDVGVCCIP